MTITKSNVPGLVHPTVQAPLAGNPNDSAIASRNATMNKQSLLNKVGGNKKYTKGGGTIPVAQMPGDTSGANAVAATTAKHSVQARADAKYDNQLGGSKRRTRGKRRRTKGKKRRTARRRTRRTKK